MNILEDFYNPHVLTPEFCYSESGIYKQISTAYDLNVSWTRQETSTSCYLYYKHIDKHWCELLWFANSNIKLNAASQADPGMQGALQAVGAAEAAIPFLLP